MPATTSPTVFIPALHMPVAVAIDRLNVLDLRSVPAQMVGGERDRSRHRNLAERHLYLRTDLLRRQGVQPRKIVGAGLVKKTESLLAAGNLLLPCTRLSVYVLHLCIG